MPPWVASVPRPTILFRKSAIDRLSCAYHPRIALNGRSSKLGFRFAYAHVSPTAINARPNIPEKNKQLYNALSELSGKAESYVNISRLQLALRGLASADAVTRVAVLSLSSRASAQKLARLLLADPLGSEEQWEKELNNQNVEDGRAVLLRFGDESDPVPPTPLYRVVPVPSRILQTHNLEILISTLNVDTLHTPAPALIESSRDAVLVPRLQVPSAKVLPVPYPVHKTIVLGEGIKSAMAYGKFIGNENADTGDMVRVAIDLPPPPEEVEVNEQSTAFAVNLDTGAKALATFRQSVANSIKYEHGWFRSGLPTLSNWLVHGLQPSESIKPAMRSLVSSIVADVEAIITKDDISQLPKLAIQTAPQETAPLMIGELEIWAERSHTELRDQLDEAFAARNWRKLAWWKLFWRVDDVTMITSEILERRWLPNAEKAGIYLAGRMHQAGFPEIVEIPFASVVPAQTIAKTDEAAAVQDSIPPSEPTKENVVEKMDISTEVHAPQPWPAQIPTSRLSLLTATVPPLQALAQSLVLSTLSTTSIASALSALLYISFPTISLFEASAITALGFVFSLRRMQKLWEGARTTWEIDVREEGRRTLKRTEEVVRLIVWGTQRERLNVPGEGVQERMEAREAVAKVRDALGKM